MLDESLSLFLPEQQQQQQSEQYNQSHSSGSGTRFTRTSLMAHFSRSGAKVFSPQTKLASTVAFVVFVLLAVVATGVVMLTSMSAETSALSAKLEVQNEALRVLQARVLALEDN